MRPVLGDAGFAGWVESTDWRPPPLTDEQRAAVSGHIAFYERTLLAAGEPEHIAVRITGLLGHWRERDGQSDGERDMIAIDWMNILGGYPLWAVCLAAEEWLTYNKWRPTVAEIRLLCDHAVRTDRLTLRLLRRLAGSEVHTAAEVRQVSDR